ncbi:MAG TPA: NAD(P)H-dependent oxidoreductase [Rhizomicrobium sp.]
MDRKILVVNGHPDPRPEGFCAALCDAYEAGAKTRGCVTRRLNVGGFRLSSLAALQDPPNASLGDVEQAYRLMRAADRLAVIYPLWADGPPLELKQLFDIVARLDARLQPQNVQRDKAARIVVTTAMPAFLYRGKDAAAGRLKGIDGAPTFIGSVDTISPGQRTRWLEQLRGFGEKLN